MPQKTPETGAEPVESPSLAEGWLCHETAGRVRVRVPERRGDDGYFAHVKEVLERHGSAPEVTTNPFTGSVLVLHRGDTSDLLAYAEKTGLFRTAKQRPRPPTGIDWFDKLGSFDPEVLSARMKERPRRSAAGLLMLAAFQALRGSVLPSATTLLGDAMRLARTKHDRTEPPSGAES